MDRLTVYDPELKRYKVKASDVEFYSKYFEVVNGAYTKPPEHFVMGNVVDKLAEYENNEEERNEIKPCPFCGGAAEYEIRREYDGNCGYEEGVVMCSECGISTPGFIIDGYYGIRYTKEQIIDIWNRRVDGGGN